jgi:hypothetical protein
VPAAVLTFFVTLVLPHVEDPWPNTIGLEFPFTAAGVGGVLASVLYAEARGRERSEVINAGGLYGFWLGAFFYALSLLNQIISGS